MIKQLTVWCDLDGVLADFDSKVSSITGMSVSDDMPKSERSKFWARIGVFVKNGGRVYQDLPLMPEAMDLWKYLTTTYEDVRILSAKGLSDPNAEHDKREWVRKHFGGKYAESAVIVSTSKDKAHYATPTSVLIDDRAKSIDPWKQAGGIGILYTGLVPTVTALTEINNGLSSSQTNT